MSTSTKNSNRKAPNQLPIQGWEVVWFVDGAKQTQAFDGPERRVYKAADDFRKAREDEARADSLPAKEYPYLQALKK